jgi:hypothetical protein
MADSNWSWKDAVIAGLWAVTMALAIAGFGSIKEGILDVKKAQSETALVMSNHIATWGKWEIQYERDRSIVWRVIDRLCGYQSDRLRKEGKLPDYFPTERNGYGSSK